MVSHENRRAVRDEPLGVLHLDRPAEDRHHHARPSVQPAPRGAVALPLQDDETKEREDGEAEEEGAAEERRGDEIRPDEEPAQGAGNSASRFGHAAI